MIRRHLDDPMLLQARREPLNGECAGGPGG